MSKILIALLVISVILEGTITSLPLVLISLIFISLHFSSEDTFLSAFLSGLFLDVLTVRSTGQTSVYFLLILLLVFLYKKKYESSSLLFTTIITFVAASIYFIIFPAPQAIVQVFIATCISGMLFSLDKRYSFQKHKTRGYLWSTVLHLVIQFVQKK